MRYISEPSNYDTLRGVINAVLECERVFPDQVFRSQLTHYVFLSFYELIMQEIFPICCRMARAEREQAFALACVEPDPQNYYYRNFHWYPIVVFSLVDSEEDYRQALNRDPGQSPADAIIHRADRIVLLSLKGTWAFYGERCHDLAVCAAREKKLLEAAYGLNEALDTADAASLMLEASAEDRCRFVSNYS